MTNLPGSTAPEASLKSEGDQEPVSVLLVDDEAENRNAFKAYFERRYTVHVAGDGVEALEVLKQVPGINVVVSDLRMPRMDGLELIRLGRQVDPDLGFIVITGNGDAESVITAMRYGARNFFMKPYLFSEIGSAMKQEAARYRLIQNEREMRNTDRAGEEFLVAIEAMRFNLSNELDWVAPFAFKLVRYMEIVGLCAEKNRFNVGLGLIELLTNAIEHGNLGVTGPEKVDLKMQGEEVYQAELARRKQDPKYRDREVSVTVSIGPEEAIFDIEDEGEGFDPHSLPDPTDPDHLFLPSGRGIMLARAFLDEVTFSPRGNSVRIRKVRTVEESG